MAETITPSVSPREKLAVEQVATLDRLSFSDPSFRRAPSESRIPHNFEKTVLTEEEMVFLRTASPKEFVEKMLEGYDPETDSSPCNFVDGDVLAMEQEIEDDVEVNSVRSGSESGRLL